MPFDEKEAIAKWRARLAETGTLFEADLDELESHLNDHIEALEEVGIHGKDAFDTAVKQLGETRALADEFAKVNPLLAWRAALFWMATGVMLVLGGYPIMQIALGLTLRVALQLHFPQLVTAMLMWLIIFASPLVTFSLIFHVAKKTLEDPLPWARWRSFRLAMVLATAVLMLGAHLGGAWGAFDRLVMDWWYPALHPDLRSAWHHMGQASYVLAVAAPLHLGFVIVRQRRLAMKDRVGAAPLFWLAIGLFIGAIRAELHMFVKSAAFATGALAKFGPSQMNALMWIVTLGCPLLLFLSAYAFLRHRAPGPTQLLRTRGILLAVGISSALAIVAVFCTGSVANRGYRLMTGETFLAGDHAYIFAGIVTSAVLPILVGSLLLRLRLAARLAAFRTD